MSDTRAIKALKKLPLVQKIDNSLWDTLIPHISFTKLAQGETLFEAGRQSKNLYVVVDGELGLYMPCGDIGGSYFLPVSYTHLTLPTILLV